MLPTTKFILVLMCVTFDTLTLTETLASENKLKLKNADNLSAFEKLEDEFSKHFQADELEQLQEFENDFKILKSFEKSRTEVESDRLLKSEIYRDDKIDESSDQDQVELREVSNSSIDSKSFPCPPPNSILPCYCSTNDLNQIFMDCSAVESEEQLAEIFQTSFPVREFHTFNMKDNTAIQRLENIFNGITFEEVDLNRIINLEFVSQYWLEGSRDTLRKLEIKYSKLNTESFPFISMETYWNLEILYITYAELAWLPPIRHNTIKRISFYGSEITSISADIFPNNHNLEFLDLSGNNITTLASGSIQFQDQKETDYFTIALDDNDMTTLEPGAFVMPSLHGDMSIVLRMDSNAIELLEEEVFGTVFPYLTFFAIAANPLVCGCDMAWLLTDELLMNVVLPTATCVDGTRLIDLDSDLYLELCDL